MEWKAAIFNQVIAIRDSKEVPLLLIMLPANFERSPEPGTYQIEEGTKRRIKKGSQIAKIDYKQAYQSTDGGGTLTITEKDGIYYFIADNISVLNSKDKTLHKISFNTGMFIEKNSKVISY